jgi:3-dehydroquinate dehydratase-2
MRKLLVIQGANMEWLGRRQPELYGTTTAATLDARLHREAGRRGVTLDIRYTNLEGEAIGWLYEAAREPVDGILINPAGFLYAGYALRDCLRGIEVPCIEVHITNLERRGLHSVTAEAALGTVAGFGLNSYFVALDAMLRHLGPPVE